MTPMPGRQWLEQHLPENALDLYRRLRFRYGFRRGRRTWSQEGEDTLLRRLFGAHKGFYVDIGAHHPCRYSNTCLLHRNGWKGINIDPLPETISLFERARPADINLCLAIGSTNKDLIYHEFNDPAFNTFNAALARKTSERVQHARLLRQRKVSTLPISQLLEDWLPPGQTIDILNVDTEGFDLEILRSNDWTRHRPKIVLAEIHQATVEQALHHPITILLNAHDYDMLSKCVNTVIYIDRGW